ncbi:Proteasomal ATPase-associated factor 1 [Branchiostoma belcheri]|nr:Proteasomal ATPase-associated factor 1 [Branchiostoma belcheri]
MRECDGSDVTPGDNMAVRMILQSDWLDALRENDGQAWLSCKRLGQPSVQGELKSMGVSNDGSVYVTASEGFQVGEVTKRSIVVSCPGENCGAKFVAPTAVFQKIHSKMVSCLDVSSGGGLGVSCSTDGTMKVWEAANGIVRRELQGHIGEVNTCRFFPSGVVVLSGGMDSQLKIWSAEDGSCPVTLRGHKGGVLDTAVIERGRNIVSCSRDGTAKLWDCGSASCLGTFSDCGGPVNGCAIGAPDNSVNLGEPDETPSDREVLTEGKLLLLACEDGVLRAFGVQSRKPVFQFAASAALNCCCFLSSVRVVCGGQDGKIYELDIRDTRQPVQLVQLSESPVLSLVPFQSEFLASLGDGTSFLPGMEETLPLQLTGPDCDPVYRVAACGNRVYSACRDGVIRKYVL